MFWKSSAQRRHSAAGCWAGDRVCRGDGASCARIMADGGAAGREGASGAAKGLRRGRRVPVSPSSVGGCSQGHHQHRRRPREASANQRGRPLISASSASPASCVRIRTRRNSASACPPHPLHQPSPRQTAHSTVSRAYDCPTTTPAASSNPRTPSFPPTSRANLVLIGRKLRARRDGPERTR